jgi:hypothetical protein
MTKDDTNPVQSAQQGRDDQGGRTSRPNDRRHVAGQDQSKRHAHPNGRFDPVDHWGKE